MIASRKESSDPSDVTRLIVWVKSRTKKDGTAVNTNAAEKIVSFKMFIYILIYEVYNVFII